MKKKTLVSVILVVALIVIIIIARTANGSSSEVSKSGRFAGTSGDRVLEVQVMILEPAVTGERVSTVGNILSNEEIEIRSEISGRIDSIFFEEGGRVRAGDVVLKINDAELQAQASRAAARLTLAEQEEQRQRLLFDKNLSSKQEYDNALTNLNLMKAEAQLVAAQLTKTVLRAPFDGKIGLRYVSVGSTINPSTLITTLQDTRTVKIDFSIPEKHALAVKVGDKLTFAIQGSPRTFIGSIYAIDPRIDPATRTLRLRGVSPNHDGTLLPGSLASVELSFRQKKTIMIPAYALIPELKSHVVYLAVNGKAEVRNVDIGIRTDQLVEIVKGVEAGDTLITSAILQLKPGTRVATRVSASGGKAQ